MLEAYHRQVASGRELRFQCGDAKSRKRRVMLACGTASSKPLEFNMKGCAFLTVQELKPSGSVSIVRRAVRIA